MIYLPYNKIQERRLPFPLRRKFMKKLALGLLSLVMLFSCLGLTACSGKEEYSRMTVDINPSIELMLDSKNKVVSATALNDDGSIILAGETVVGKKADEAVEIIVEVSTETGYIVKGNVEADENTVSISVSANTKNLEKVKESAEKAVTDFFEKHDIQGKVEHVQALKTDALRELAKNNSIYSEEEINEMSEEQLYKVIAIGRIETAQLASQAMRDAYFRAKEYEISLADREETAKVIQAMGGLYTATHTLYKTALDAYSSAIVTIDEWRYDTFVSPDSDYQKSLQNLRDKKADLLEQKRLVASVNVNDQIYAELSVSLQQSEEAYDKALAAYEALGAELNTAIETMVSSLKKIEAKLVEIEESFSDDITEKLNEKVKEIDKTLNEKKDAFFEKFETEHAEDIRKINGDLEAKKQELINSVNSATANA